MWAYMVKTRKQDQIPVTHNPTSPKYVISFQIWVQIDVQNLKMHS